MVALIDRGLNYWHFQLLTSLLLLILVTYYSGCKVLTKSDILFILFVVFGLMTRVCSFWLPYSEIL